MDLYQLGLQDRELKNPRTRIQLKTVLGVNVPITSYYHNYLKGYHYQKPVVCPFCKSVQGISGVDEMPWECPECGAT